MEGWRVRGEGRERRRGVRAEARRAEVIRRRSTSASVPVKLNLASPDPSERRGERREEEEQ